MRENWVWKLQSVLWRGSNQSNKRVQNRQMCIWNIYREKMKSKVEGEIIIMIRANKVQQHGMLRLRTLLKRSASMKLTKNTNKGKNSTWCTWKIWVKVGVGATIQNHPGAVAHQIARHWVIWMPHRRIKACETPLISSKTITSTDNKWMVFYRLRKSNRKSKTPKSWRRNSLSDCIQKQRWHILLKNLKMETDRQQPEFQ